MRRLFLPIDIVSKNCSVPSKLKISLPSYPTWLATTRFVFLLVWFISDFRKELFTNVCEAFFLISSSNFSFLNGNQVQVLVPRAWFDEGMQPVNITFCYCWLTSEELKVFLANSKVHLELAYCYMRENSVIVLTSYAYQFSSDLYMVILHCYCVIALISCVNYADGSVKQYDLVVIGGGSGGLACSKAGYCNIFSLSSGLISEP